MIRRYTKKIEMYRERSKIGVVLILPFLLLKILFILHDVRSCCFSDASEEKNCIRHVLLQKTTERRCTSEEAPKVWPYQRRSRCLAYDVMHGLVEDARGRGRPI